MPAHKSGSIQGLSPRVRGNPYERIRVRLKSGSIPGSIPACAGEPYFYAATPSQLLVYPRVCGGTAIERGAGHG